MQEITYCIGTKWHCMRVYFIYHTVLHTHTIVESLYTYVYAYKPISDTPMCACTYVCVCVKYAFALSIYTYIYIYIYICKYVPTINT